MNKPFQFAKIVLDDPRSVYYAGQLLAGYIECQLTQHLNFTANINFIGEAITLWTETEQEEYNGIRRTRNVEYRGREEYFNHTQPLYGGGGVISQLPPGSHKVPFSFQVPHSIPSTFTGSHGNIRYKVIAYIDYADPSLERDILEKEFEVVAPLNLDNEEGRSPIDIDFEEFYSCCCSSSPMAINIKIPQTGFCPGQTIPININVKNDTNTEIKSILFELVQHSCYRTSHPKSEFTPKDIVLKTARTGAFLAHATRTAVYEIDVPDMIAPNLDDCDIMDMGFGLKALVKLSGCNDDLEDDAEIILGLVPIPGTPGAANYVHPMKTSLPQGPLPVPPPEGTQEVPSHVPNANAYPQNSPYPAPQTYPTASPYPAASPVPGYHGASPVPGYHGASPVPGYHGASPVPGYHGASPVPGYHGSSPHPQTVTSHQMGVTNSPYPSSSPNQGYPMPAPAAGPPSMGFVVAPTSSPHVSVHSSHLAASQGYPPSNSPYPAARSPHLNNSLRPGGTSPYPVGNIGASASPHAHASPYTPLMQGFSPAASAPPPS